MPLPLFEQPIAGTLKVVPGSQDYVSRIRQAITGERPDSIAHTQSYGNKIFVDDPSKMTEPIEAHEVMHKIQEKAGAVSPLSLTDRNYDYGGLAGLQKLKSVSQLGTEQQADIPRNYQEQMNAWTKGQITPRVLAQADQLNQAYARPMRQLAGMAADTIDTTPQAPGPPPAALTGMIKPLPEVGGPTLYRSKLK